MNLLNPFDFATQSPLWFNLFLFAFAFAICIFIFFVVQKNKSPVFQSTLSNLVYPVLPSDYKLITPDSYFVSASQSRVECSTPTLTHLQSTTYSEKCELTVSNNGDLQYCINSTVVWKSSSIRKLTSCPEMLAMMSFITNTTFSSWDKGFEANNFIVYIAPLAITYLENGIEQLVWTFTSGWNALAMCRSISNCTVPAFAASLYTAMFSSNGVTVSIADNGDLVSSKNGGVLSSLHSSLQDSRRG